MTFNIVDGTLKINPINVTVTITGNTNVATFDGTPHTVTGYVATCENTLYNVHGDFTFSGDSTATQTSVGTKNMGLAANQFTNTNTNFGTVTFNVTDGYQRVVAPNAVTVTITEHSGTVNYNGAEQRVTGYDVTSIKIGDEPTTLYTAADFTLTSIEIGGEPTTLYTAADFTFSGCDTAKGTNAGTYAMNLSESNFTNTNTNFDNVAFVIVNGSLKINPIDVTVAITGNTATVNYDGQSHTVTGYTASCENTLYNVSSDFTFSGEAKATRTDAGTTNMNLSESQFENTNTNFGTVTFSITDGKMSVNPINVTVTITEYSDEVNYNGAEQRVTGYDVTSIKIGNEPTTLYTAADFTFSGCDTAKGTNAGTYAMNLTPANFTNTNTNFGTVTFNIVDGTLTINPINVTVTITGNTNVATFDGDPHTVTGYVATCENTLYNVHGDFTFSGDSTATQTAVGTKNMGLAANQFTNTNSNFGTVTFNVTDGYQSVVAPGTVTVTITEHSGTVNYNGAEQRVTGYDVTSIEIGGEPTTLYTAADFTFSGCDTAKGHGQGHECRYLCHEPYAC